MLNVFLSALLGLTLVVAQAAWAEAPAPRPPAPTVLPVKQASGTVLTVTPDQADWMYAAGAIATLRIRLAVDLYPEGGVAVRYRLGPEMLDAPEQRAVVPAEGLLRSGTCAARRADAASARAVDAHGRGLPPQLCQRSRLGRPQPLLWRAGRAARGWAAR